MSNPREEYFLSPTYGKQSVPVFKIRKQGPRHSIVDMMIKIMLDGNVSLSWLTGDNCQILPTETQKNTCYALALKTEFTSVEDYALALGRDILARHTPFSKVTIDIQERMWERMKVGGKEHNHVFYTANVPIKRTCHVVVHRDGRVEVTSGVCDIRVMKTTQSGFMGYIEDEYTNLKPVGAGGSSPDRIMCSDMVGRWAYLPGKAPEGRFFEKNEKILQTLLEVFAGNPETGVFSKSLQETAYNMATKVLSQFPEIESVTLETPNVHFYTYPLEQFGLQNPNIVFQSTDSLTTASGRIITHVSRNKPQAKL